MSDVDLSQVRNASRDVAEGLKRFERDYERLQRQVRVALEKGASEIEVQRAANSALNGHPDLQERMADFMRRMDAANRESHHGDSKRASE